MKILKIFAWILGFCVLSLAAVLAMMRIPDKQGITSDDRQRIMGDVRAQMKDPYTAIVEDLVVYREGSVSLNFCGTVNAKNSFGAYVGRQLFEGYYNLNDRRTVSIEIDDGGGHSTKLREKCAEIAVRASLQRAEGSGSASEARGARSR